MTRLHFTQMFHKVRFGLAAIGFVDRLARLSAAKSSPHAATTGVTTTLTADTGNATESPGVSELRRVKVNFFYQFNQPCQQ